ncbi:prephenate dehydratase [Sphingobacterium mizutaii NBRC 14946 = DSM 11724]|uniref:prephenate dehydratase n=2 Tax=Sphingobacterium mizutaii TaxID=1010 RepID=A0AAJ4XF42_9SPHI|nr:prephenate dehydratase [Sphingobacterium mizutaii]GEM67227.1 prephenate dehydratase [Sphingobacterium mizutaii NBRC 14946 = DSM 11724]SDL28884.1 prephenate dehydratase [Sphingobacterium mizutaii]SNV53893.1 P-protein [Sphingobacterium mizutaii]
MSEKIKIAIQGVKASFHEEAAYKYFGKDIETLECTSFKKTCDLLKQGKADYVVMAIENSIAGSILPNYNLLRDYRFHIIGEVHLNIQQHLLALPGVKLSDIQFVESHPIAIRQCDEFLSDHPEWTIKEGMDTAACAKKILDEKLTHTAAIASEAAAKLYGLEILEKRIETHKKNSTRFLILSNELQEQKNANKASLSFQTSHAIGALAMVLQCFAEQNVNLSKIQSMPVVGRRNEYDFYVDVEWKKQADYDAAIRKVLKHTVNFSIMGEYLKNEKI